MMEDNKVLIHTVCKIQQCTIIYTAITVGCQNNIAQCGKFNADIHGRS